MAGGGARWGEVDGYWVPKREHPTRRQEEDEGGEHEDVDRGSWWGEWRRGTKGVRDEGGLRHGGAEGDKAGEGEGVEEEGVVDGRKGCAARVLTTNQ
jgi:hypothetical protein